MAIKANIVIDQGADFVATIDLVDANNQVFDLTGYSVASQMRKNYAASVAVTFTASHDSSGGQISLSLNSANTANIVPGRYLYDVEVTSPGGIVDRVVEGIVTVTPGMTRV